MHDATLSRKTLLTLAVIAAAVSFSLPVLAMTVHFTVDLNENAAANANIAGANVNAHLNANLTPGLNIDGSTLLNVATSVNTPEARLAVNAAAAASKSPELQGAVKSFWRTAWDATRPVLVGFVKAFFGAFIAAWNVATTPSATVNANVSVNAQVTK
jgi:hypothetical protein